MVDRRNQMRRSGLKQISYSPSPACPALTGSKVCLRHAMNPGKDPSVGRNKTKSRHYDAIGLRMWPLTEDGIGVPKFETQLLSLTQSVCCLVLLQRRFSCVSEDSCLLRL